MMRSIIGLLFMVVCLTTPFSGTVFSQMTVEFDEIGFTNSGASWRYRVSFPSFFERYTSSRLTSMGGDLGGIVEDFASDLHRNPAFAILVEEPYSYAEMAGKGFGGGTLFGRTTARFAVRNANDDALRFGFIVPTKVGKFGFSAGGSYKRDDSADFDISDRYYGGALSIQSTNRTVETMQKKLDIHVWYARNLSENMVIGLDLTSGSVNQTTKKDVFNESKRIAPSFPTSYENKNFNESNLNANQEARSWIGRLGLLWMAPGQSRIDLVGKFESADAPLIFSDTRRYHSITLRILGETGDTTQIDESDDFSSKELEASVESDYISVDIILSSDPSKNRRSRYILGFESQTLKIVEEGKIVDDEHWLYKIEGYINSRDDEFEETFSASRPDISSFALKLGWGMEVNEKRITFGTGVRTLIYAGSAENTLIHDAKLSRVHIENETTTSADSLFSGQLKIKTEFTGYAVSVPLGIEFFPAESFAIRFGISPRYVYWKKTTEISDQPNLYDVYGDISISRSFGVGYHFSDKFRGDIYARDEIMKMSNWRLSLQYSF